MKMVCDGVQINLSHPIFKSVIIGRKTLLAIGEGFYMKFFFKRREGDTFYGDFIETVAVGGEREADKILKEVLR